MTDNEFFERSLEVSTEFDRYVFAHPEVAEKIPENALVIFLLEDDSKFSKKSLEIARKQREEGQPVILVKIKGLAPPVISRLIEPRLEVVSTL